MDIKDELDAMLDNLKTGGRPANTQKPVPKTARTIPPQTAPRRSSYDSMSVDDLLKALSENNKPKKPNKQPSEPAETPRTAVRSVPDSSIPKNILDMIPSQESPVPKKKATEPTVPVVSEEKKASPETRPEPVSQPAEEKPRKKRIVISRELPDYEAIRSRELEKSAAAPRPEKEEDTVSSPAEPAPDNEAVECEEVPASDESAANNAEESLYEPEAETAPAEETADESAETTNDATDDDTETSQPPESAGSNKKSGLFAGLKALFRKKSGSADEVTEPEETGTPVESLSEPQPFEINEELPETADALSAAELIDAALAANEEVQLEIAGETVADELSGTPEDNDSTEEYSSPADELIADMREDAADAIAVLSHTEEENSNAAEETPQDSQTETPESEESSPADELIADIREDAADAIAGLSRTEEEKSDAAEGTSQDSQTEAVESEESEPVEIDVDLGGQTKKSRIISTLEKILEENPGTIADERSEKTEPDEIDVSIKKDSGKLKRRIYAVFGVIFTVLAVIGLVSVIKSGTAHFRSFTAGENKKDSFTDIIYPAVIMDIESFNSPSELSSDQIISAALWSLVMSGSDMDKYEKTFDVISVPAIDVEAYAAKLFGDSLPELTHATVGSGELKFYYNEETKSYNVPVNPITFTYEPDITSVSKNDSEYIVTVDYIKELPAWMKENQNYGKEVSKTVEFRLNEKDGAYTISSMTVINVNAVL